MRLDRLIHLVQAESVPYPEEYLRRNCVVVSVCSLSSS
jgi:hypothetical protein